MPKVGKGRTRIQLTLDTELMNEINAVCEKAHMSRSAWIEYTLGMAIHAYDDLLAGLSEAMSKGMFEGVEVSKKE